MLSASACRHRGIRPTTATPIVAGVLSRTIHDVRAALGDRDGIESDGAMATGTTPSGTAVRYSSKVFWDALNATAVYYNATDWNPLGPKPNQTVYVLTF